jgi:multidrug efflux pump subunit AcrB
MLCPEGQVQVFGAPAVSGLGRAGGFRIMIEDRGDVGPATLQGQTEEFIRTANSQEQVVGLFTVFKTNSPQLVLTVNRTRAWSGWSRWATCTRACRGRWAAGTRTTSTGSAARGR